VQKKNPVDSHFSQAEDEIGEIEVEIDLALQECKNKFYKMIKLENIKKHYTL
jgi:hypothetical protein